MFKFNSGWRIAAFKNGVIDNIAYPINFFFELLGELLIPAAIQWILWYSIFKMGGQQTAGGHTYSELMTYTWTSLLFTQIRGGNQDFQIAEKIRNGSLSNYLVRPVGMVEFTYIQTLAPKFFVLVLSLSIGMVASFFFHLDPLRILGAVAMATVGNLIHFLLSASLATVAFYWEEAYAVLIVKNMMVQFLSGELLPLNLFPDQWTWIWKSLPFYIYVYSPTQFVLGRMSWGEYLHQMGIALIWLGVARLILHFAWNRGIKHYESVGG